MGPGPMGPGAAQGAPPGGGGGGEMSPQLQQAAQAIMAIEDPGELAAVAMLVQKKGEQLQGGPQGPQGAPQGQAPPMGPMGGAPAGM